jgi:hypothetical protein
MNFAGDQIDGAQKVFSKFLSEPHDRKAAQLGEFFYVGGTVSLPNFPVISLLKAPAATV